MSFKCRSEASHSSLAVAVVAVVVDGGTVTVHTAQMGAAVAGVLHRVVLQHGGVTELALERDPGGVGHARVVGSGVRVVPLVH